MRKLCALLLLGLPILTVGQQPAGQSDSVIFSLNAFASDAEKKSFREISATGKTDYLQLLLLSDQKPDKTPLEKIESFIQSKEWIRNKKAIGTKDLKRIYKEVHDAFLTQYVDNPNFSQIFQNGNYNCATASALYAFLLDRFSIKYNIRETPVHVYIVAEPETNNVVFETTTPAAKVLTYDDKAKNHFLEYLYENKMISKEEWTGSDKNELFNKYFYTDKPIGIKELVGLLYYNKGIAAMELESYKEAYKFFEKSYFFYPQEKLKYFVSTSLAVMLFKEEEQLDEDEKLRYFLRYMQLDNKNMGKQLIGNYVEQSAKKYLFQNPDPRKYHAIYRDVMSQVTDSALRSDIRHDHYANCARYHDIKSQYDSSLNYLDSLYWMNTNDLLVQELVVQNIARQLVNLSDEKRAFESLGVYFKAFPFAKENGKMQEIYLYCLTKVVNDYYDEENAKEGKKYLDTLKAAIDGKPSLAKKVEMYLGQCIGEVCGYHVRREEYKAARDLLLFMKKLLPDNEDLERRLAHVTKRLNLK